MKPLIGAKLNGVMLYAQDLRRASTWYCDNLGLQLAEHHFDDFAELAIEGQYVMHLFKVYDLTPISRAVFSFQTDDIDHAYQTLVNNGAEVYSIEVFGDHKSFCFKDCEGNMLMMSQYA
ncbi:VOC family protein [Paenibacillus spongiae]|uniref:VOC family protein n=1 Tax=Paenibacillus spongiae TaxID=2909671 RepID=A0ABY5SGJ9_9BACL|nr:VOC family protein [Paenibacillus spongiae]UVI33116.1 VOC family protein [Paenibacillus spongiae]